MPLTASCGVRTPRAIGSWPYGALVKSELMPGTPLPGMVVPREFSPMDLSVANGESKATLFILKIDASVLCNPCPGDMAS